MRCRHHSRGFTLVELLVSMMVALLVWSVVVFVVQSLTRQPVTLNHRVQAREVAAHMMQKIVRELAAARRVVRIVDSIFPDTTEPQVQRISFVIPAGLTGQPDNPGSASCHAFGSPLAPDPNDPNHCLDPPPDGLTHYLQLHKYSWRDVINQVDPLAYEFVTGGPTVATPEADFTGQIHELLPDCRLQLSFVLEVSYRALQGTDWVTVNRRVYTGDPDPLHFDGVLTARQWLDALFDNAFQPAPSITDLAVHVQTIHVQLTVHHETEQAMLHHTVRCPEKPQVNRYYNQVPPA